MEEEKGNSKCIKRPNSSWTALLILLGFLSAFIAVSNLRQRALLRGSVELKQSKRVRNVRSRSKLHLTYQKSSVLPEYTAKETKLNYPHVRTTQLFSRQLALCQSLASAGGCPQIISGCQQSTTPCSCDESLQSYYYLWSGNVSCLPIRSAGLSYYYYAPNVHYFSLPENPEPESSEDEDDSEEEEEAPSPDEGPLPEEESPEEAPTPNEESAPEEPDEEPEEESPEEVSPQEQSPPPPPPPPDVEDEAPPPFDLLEQAARQDVFRRPRGTHHSGASCSPTHTYL